MEIKEKTFTEGAEDSKKRLSEENDSREFNPLIRL